MTYLSMMAAFALTCAVLMVIQHKRELRRIRQEAEGHRLRRAAAEAALHEAHHPNTLQRRDQQRKGMHRKGQA